MSQAYLIIEQTAYELWLDEKLLARLNGGAASFMAGAGPQLREIDIEAAIERSEEWLMPFSKLLAGLTLKVSDRTDRLRRHFGDQASCSVAQVEQAFTVAHWAVADRRAHDRDSIADIVLLRELAHHGRLSGVVWDSAESKPARAGATQATQR